MKGSNRTLVFLVGIVATILLGWVLHVGAGILQPLVIALLLASMLQPVVRALARVGIPPLLTVITLVVTLFLGFARLGLLIQTTFQSFIGEGRPNAERTVVPEPPVALPGSEPEPVAPGSTVSEAPHGAPTQAPKAEERTASETDGQAASEGSEREEEAAGASPGKGEAEPPEAVAQDDESPPAESPTVFRSLVEDQERINEGAGGWEGLVEKMVKRVESSSMPQQMKEYVAHSLREVDPEQVAPDLFSSSFSFTKGLLLVLLYMVFIFAEQTVFRRKILSIAGRRRNDAADILDTIGRGIQRYLGVKTIVSLATGSLCYAGLAILQVPYAALWGFLTFALNYIPTFGSIVATCFPTITSFAVNGSWGRAMLIVAIYISVNTALGTIIEPRILGRELNLSPLVVVLSVVVWAGIWGVVGSFLAVPLTSILQIVLASQETTRPIAVMLSSGKGLDADPPPAGPSPPRAERPQAKPPAVERREKTA